MPKLKPISRRNAAQNTRIKDYFTIGVSADPAVHLSNSDNGGELSQDKNNVGTSSPVITSPALPTTAGPAYCDVLDKYYTLTDLDKTSILKGH